MRFRFGLMPMLAVAAGECLAAAHGMPTGSVPASGIGRTILASNWMFPAANIVHVIGMLLIVGPILMLDFRLLGLTRAGPVADLSRALRPWPVLGACLAVPAGLAMFTAEAADLITNPAFRWKILLLIVVSGNAVVYGIFAAEDAQRCASGDLPSFQARLHAALSAALWLAIVACGRLIAYLN